MELSVCKADINNCNEVKAHTNFYVVRKLPTSTGLCLDATISTYLI